MPQSAVPNGARCFLNGGNSHSRPRGNIRSDQPLISICTICALLTASNIYAADTSTLLSTLVFCGEVDNQCNNVSKIYNAYGQGKGNLTGTVLAKIAYRTRGIHQVEIRIINGDTNVTLDRCTYPAANVTKLPHTHTLTYGIFQPVDGTIKSIKFSVYDKLKGKTTHVGSVSTVQVLD